MLTEKAATAYKNRVRETWARGDYGKLAARVMPIAEHLCQATDIRPGANVLDIATGTGNVAIVAARRGASVTAVDLTPRMIDLTDERGRSENLEIVSVLGDAEDLPFAAGTFGAALSVCGLWWAPRPDVAVAEARRVLRPGGIVGLAGFTSGSYFGQVEELIKSYRPLPDGVPERNDWADEDVARTRLQQHFADVVSLTATIPWNFENAAAATDFLFTNSASHIAAHDDLPAEDIARLTEDVEQFTARSSTTQETIRIDLEYRILVGRVPA